MRTAVRCVVVGGLALACASVTAQDCPRLETELPFGGPTQVAVLGDLAYFGIGKGVMVVDGSDPTSLRVLARLPLPGEVTDIAVDGARAYVAMGETGVQVLDVSEPADPRPLAVIDTPGEARAVDVGGGWLLVADGPAGLCSIPLTTPGAAACASTGQYAIDVEVEDAMAVVLFNGTHLAVVDLDKPGGPSVVGSLPMPHSTAVAVEGDLAAVSCGEDGLKVVDLSQPAEPVVVGGLDLPGWTGRVELRGGLAHVATSYFGESGLKIVDVTDPSLPVELGSLVSPDGWGTLDLAVSGDRVFLAEGHGARVIDVSEPSSLTVLGRLASERAVGLEVEGELGFVASGGYPGSMTGVTILDVADPERPRDLSSIELPSPAGDLVAGGNLLCVGQGELLRVFDVSIPEVPVEVGSTTVPCPIRHLELGGSLLFVAGDCGLRVVDVAEPAVPTVVGVLEDPPWSDLFWIETFLVRGDYVYVGWAGHSFVSFGALAVADVSTPSRPVWVGAQVSGISAALALDNDRLTSFACYPGFQGMNTLVMEVFEVTSPASPVLIGQGPYAVVWGGCDLFADLEPHAGLLYLMSGGVIVYDPLAPWDPDGISSYEAEWAAAGEFSGGRLLVADEYRGVLVLDPSCVGSLFADDFESGDSSRWSLAVP